MMTTEAQRAEALKVYAATINNCQKMQPKFAPGTAQATLLLNRINALQVAAAVVGGNQQPLTNQELNAAIAPLASILHKTTKARSKYQPAAPTYQRLTPMIAAMVIGLDLIKQRMSQQEIKP
ncbi:hypothetical protein [Lacticaseibacillus jixiensis]|uniref:hypothetical protein n=1 Tax=Lacticaseibacillus jixiensis TaxID=3231926 RepID=UPI0036F3F5EC